MSLRDMASTKDLVLVAARISQGKKRGAGKKRARLWASGFNIEAMAVYRQLLFFVTCDPRAVENLGPSPSVRPFPCSDKCTLSDSVPFMLHRFVFRSGCDVHADRGGIAQAISTAQDCCG